MPARRLIVFCAALFAAILLALANVETAVFFGDVPVYESRANAILDGGLPYLDVPFEHLPLSVIPLLAAAVVGMATGTAFATVLVVFNACLLFVTFRLSEASAPGGSVRWLLLTAPLLPLIVMRLDPLALMLAAASLAAVVHRRISSGGVAASLGTLARGWPVVMSWVLWRRGARRWALGLIVLAAVMMVVLLLTPGFAEERSFTGIHLETAVGSLVVVWRHLTGADPQIVTQAGAAYVSGPGLLVVLNAAIGLAVTAPALRRGLGGPLPVGPALLTYGLILVSPLLSAQFLSWPLVFVAAVAVAPRALIVATGLTTFVTLFLWYPDSAWWAAILLARNLALLATPWLIVRGLARNGQSNSSLRNLPV